jgi:hypothetical protein
MALATYGDLKSTVKSFLHRTDLDGDIPTFITLAESELNRRLRVREMEVRATSTMQQYLDMPADFLELRNIQINDGVSNISLVYMSPTDIDLHYGLRTGRPIAFTFVADQFQFAPSPDSGYQVEIDYYQRIPALSDTNTTNWLLSAYADVYLAASMVQAAWYIQDASAMQAWQARLNSSIEQLEKSDRKSRFGGPNMSIRPDSSTP